MLIVNDNDGHIDYNRTNQPASDVAVAIAPVGAAFRAPGSPHQIRTAASEARSIASWDELDRTHRPSAVCARTSYPNRRRQRVLTLSGL